MFLNFRIKSMFRLRSCIIDNNNSYKERDGSLSISVKEFHRSYIWYRSEAIIIRKTNLVTYMFSNVTMQLLCHPSCNEITAILLAVCILFSHFSLPASSRLRSWVVTGTSLPQQSAFDSVKLWKISSLRSESVILHITTGGRFIQQNYLSFILFI